MYDLGFIFCFSSADRGSSPAKHFIEMLRVLSTEPLKKCRDRRPRRSVKCLGLILGKNDVTTRRGVLQAPAREHGFLLRLSNQFDLGGNLRPQKERTAPTPVPTIQHPENAPRASLPLYQSLLFVSHRMLQCVIYITIRRFY